MLLLLPLLSLAACSTEAPPPIVLTETKVERVPIPAEKLRCPVDKPVPPPKPTAGTTLASYVAAFIARLEHWGDGCAARLDEIWELQSRPIGATPAPPILPTGVPMKPVQ